MSAHTAAAPAVDRRRHPTSKPLGFAGREHSRAVVSGPVDTPPALSAYCCYRRTSHSTADFVRPVLASIEVVVAHQEQACPKHQQRDYRLVCVQRGRYRCRLNGKLLELGARDLLLVKRGDWLEEMPQPPLQFVAVNFDLDRGIHSPTVDILFAANTPPEHQVVRGPNTEIRRLLERMREESRQHDHFVPHIENGLLLQLFSRVARALPPGRLSPFFLERPTVQGFRERLYRVFEQNLAQNFSATAIAARMGVSMRTLTKRCQEVCGAPPARAFKQYKIEYAARALRQSDLPIKDISHRLGFQNPYHFSRVFRLCVGVPPSHYRDGVEPAKPASTR